MFTDPPTMVSHTGPLQKLFGTPGLNYGTQNLALIQTLQYCTCICLTATTATVLSASAFLCPQASVMQTNTMLQAVLIKNFIQKLTKPTLVLFHLYKSGSSFYVIFRIVRIKLDCCSIFLKNITHLQLSTVQVNYGTGK